MKENVKSFSKKFLSVVLSIFLIASTIPFASLSVFAEGEKVDYTVIVQNSQGEKISGATVTIDTETETTDTEDGKAVFNDITIGTYDTTIVADGYVDYSASILVSAENTEATVTLLKEVTISGNILKADTDALEELSISVRRTDIEGTVTPSVSGEAYSFKAVEGGTYEVKASAKFYVEKTETVTAGTSDSTQNVQLALKKQKIKVTFNNGGSVKVNGESKANDNEVEVTVKSGTATIGVNADDSNGYHIKSVSFDSVEKYNNAKTKNSEKNAEIAFSDSITINEDLETGHTVVAEFEINKYDITKTSAHGNAVLSATTVEHNSSASISVVPEYNYNIKSIKANGNDVLYSIDSSSKDKYVSNEVTNITEDTEFVVNYEQYSSVDFDDAVTFSKEIKKVEDTYYYADAATITSKCDGININNVSTTNDLRAVKTNTINATTTISSIDVYSISDKKWSSVTLANDISVVIDTQLPEVTVDKFDENGVWTKDNVTITGSAVDNGDAGIDRVVYSTKSGLTKTDILAITAATPSTAETIADDADVSDVVTLDTDNKFTVTFDKSQDKTYYFYAIDNSNNVSELKSFEIKIDKTAPLITDVEFSDVKDDLKTELLNFFTFGTITSDDVYITITAKDANNPESSAIKNLELYYTVKSQENTKVKVDSVNEPITSDDAGGAQSIYKFKIAGSELNDKDEMVPLTATVVDNAGNSSTLKDATDKSAVDSNAYSYNLMVSKASPDAAFTVINDSVCREKISDNSKEHYVTKNAGLDFKTYKYWYNDTVDFTVDVNDTIVENGVHCGINEVIIKVNDVVVKDDVITTATNPEKFEDVVKNKQYDVNTALADNERQGENNIEIKVINNNGFEDSFSMTVYVDTSSPKFESVNIEATNAENENVFKKFLNLLTFGIFYNDKIDVTLTASDSIPGTMIDYIELYNVKDTSNIEESAELLGKVNSAVVENNISKSVFTIPAEIEDGKVNLEGNLFAIAYDKAGNHTKLIDIADIDKDDDIKSNRISIENENPTIGITIENAHTELFNENTKNDAVWYGNDIVIKVDANDSKLNNSGIRSTVTKVNGIDKLSAEYYTADSGVYTYSDVIDTSNCDIPTENGELTGKYEIESTITDNAGNTGEDKVVFYIDRYDPQITNFDFNAKSRKDEKENDFVSKQTYGFYFIKDTEVTISAEDTNNGKQPSAGIKTISYKLVSKDQKAEDVEWTTENVTKDNTITVKVPQGFKGQIYAKATDNVNHTGNTVNPSGVIIEETKSTVEFFRTANTPAVEKTVDGQDLYNADVNVPFTVNDSDDDENKIVSSGIYKVEFAVSVPENLSGYYKAQNRTGYIIINNQGNIQETKVFDVNGKEVPATEKAKYCQWNFKKDANDNLVHSVNGNIFVDNDSNGIVVSVRVEDRSGNVSDWFTDSFAIDKTAPTVQITYKDNKQKTGSYEQFYNADRVATLTVTERNFDSARIMATLSNLDPDYEYAPMIETINQKKDDGSDYWKHNVVEEDPNTNTYTYKIKYNTGDGIYDFVIDSIYDLAGNSFDKSKSTFTDKFIIDKTSSKLTVDYYTVDSTKTMGSQPEMYSNKLMKATFTLVEHNADVIIGKKTSTDVTSQKTQNTDIKSATVVSTNSKDKNVQVKQFAEDLNWKKVAKDTYQATFDLNQQAAYEIKVDGQDMAGNKVNSAINSMKFAVDTNAPILEIEGIKQTTFASYNSKQITPVIKLHDVAGNLDVSTVKITIQGTKKSHPLFEVTSDSFSTQSSITDGIQYVTQYFNDDIENKDDIYKLHVEASDMAKNSISNDFYFSVNRFGSTYVYDISKLDENYFDNAEVLYTKNVLGSVLFTEINCDFINRSKTEVNLVYTNTNQQKQTQKLLKENVDYKIVNVPSKENDVYNIKQYQYQLTNADLFSLDGVYQLFVTTYDDATNINENDEQNGKVKETQQVLRFVVDNNAPVINAEATFEKFAYADNHTKKDDEIIIKKNSSKINDSQFASDGSSATIILNIDELNLDLDAIDEKSIDVTYDGKAVKTKLDEENGTYKYTFDLAKNFAGRDLVVNISDKAGNARKLTVENLVVTNNAFIRYINNTVAVICTLAGVVAVATGIVVFIIMRNKKLKNLDD